MVRCYGTIVRAMSCPGESDNHDVNFVIHAHASYRFPPARTVTFPNEPVSGRHESRNTATSLPFERRVRPACFRRTVQTRPLVGR